MLRLFICFVIKDEILVSEFINHFTSIKSNGIISEWYNKKIETEKDFQDEININLNNSNINCLSL